MCADYGTGPVGGVVSGNPKMHQYRTHRDCGTDDRHTFTVCKGVDDHAQGRKTLVDLLGFLQCLTTGPRLANLFRTSEIDQKEITSFLSTRLYVTLLNTDDKDRV